MSKAAELAKMGEVLTNSQIGGRRNIIINGAMQVAQRGTSFANIGTSAIAYGLDRFGIRNATDGAVTVTQDTSVPNTEFLKSMKLDVTTADSSIGSSQIYSVQYRVEGQDLAQLGFGQSGTRYFTLSFYHKHTKTGTHCVGITNSAGNRAYAAEYTQSVSDTWEQAKIVIPVDTTGTWLTTTEIGARIYFVLAAGSDFHASANTWTANNTFVTSNQVNNLDSTSNNFFLTGIQLEVGSQATPFEHRSFNEEFTLCQRYCTVYNVGGDQVHDENLIHNSAPLPGSSGHIDVANRGEWFLSYPIKRATPTITVTNPTELRWLSTGNVVQNGTSDVTFPVGTGIQRTNCFQSVAGSLTTSHHCDYWGHDGGSTYARLLIDSEL